LDELRAISGECKLHNLYLHMDGARFANACASLGCSPAETSWKSGVDVLCFGGTKNGLAVGEAVIFFDRKLAADFDYRCKQAGQLASKMRFLAAPWVGMLESGAWLRNAVHANSCAKHFAAQIADIPGIRIAAPVEANAMFLSLSEEILSPLRARGWKFYTFIGGATRFMFSWDSDLSRVDTLCRDLKECGEHVSSPSPIPPSGKTTQFQCVQLLPAIKIFAGSTSRTARWSYQVNFKIAEVTRIAARAIAAR
jgi:threonine aldolase